jgi:hypothetical protein
MAGLDSDPPVSGDGGRPGSAMHRPKPIDPAELVTVVASLVGRTEGSPAEP